ncbi:unnamed protein product, partial [Staurois parvus]
MRCLWYTFLFFEFRQGHRGPMIPLLPGGPMSCQSTPWLQPFSDVCECPPVMPVNAHQFHLPV